MGFLQGKAKTRREGTRRTGFAWEKAAREIVMRESRARQRWRWRQVVGGFDFTAWSPPPHTWREVNSGLGQVFRLLDPIPTCLCKGLGCSNTNNYSQDTSWVSYDLTQFWHDLPGDSIRVHRLRVRSHEPPTLAHFRCHSQVQIVNCASDQLAINQRFPWPPPRVRLICNSISKNSE